MKTRLLSIALVAILLFSMVSCDLLKSKDEEPKTETPTINVYTLNGTTGFGMAKLMNDAKAGTTTEKYNFSVQTDASNVTAALLNGSADIAALPTNAAANIYNKSEGGVVVRRAFLESYPEAVENFLKEYKASIEYLSTDRDSAAQMIVDNGIFTSAPVAKKALPNCNVCFLDGAAMKSAMQTYLDILFGIAPASVGNKLPADDFYYAK